MSDNSFSATVFRWDEDENGEGQMAVRRYRDTARVYLDMDGVLADFDGTLKKSGMTLEGFKRLPGAYARLPIMEGAVEGVFELYMWGFELFVLSKIPRSNPGAAAEKIIWLYQHFPIFQDRIIITPDKGAVGSRRDFLIDDHPEWANADNFPGMIIKFNGDWKEVVRQILKNKT